MTTALRRGEAALRAIALEAMQAATNMPEPIERTRFSRIERHCLAAMSDLPEMPLSRLRAIEAHLAVRPGQRMPGKW